MTNIFSRWFGTKDDDEPVRDVAALAEPLAAPAVHIVKTDAPTRSHFGGVPNLPPGVDWPERQGARLGFLARLSLSEIYRAHPIDWLPHDGALLFFYDMDQQSWGFDPKDRGSAAVLRVPDLPDPVAQPDAGTKGHSSALPHRNAAFRRIDTIPSVERDAASALELSDKESDLYIDLAHAVFQGAPQHQVAGFPSPVQGDGMELECQLVSHGIYCGDQTGYADPRVGPLMAGASDWRLLLQFDSDDDLGVMWGDAGVIYYWVEAHAARAGRFDNAWLILQCC
jgi:uncharacterized protein YwqG